MYVCMYVCIYIERLVSYIQSKTGVFPLGKDKFLLPKRGMDSGPGTKQRQKQINR